MNTFLVVVDSTKSADRIVAAALSLIQDIHVKLVFSHLVEESGQNGPAKAHSCSNEPCKTCRGTPSRYSLDAYVRKAHDQGVFASVRTACDNTWNEIFAYAERNHAHLIVTKSPTAGEIEANELLKSSPCPIVFVPDLDAKEVHEIEHRLAAVR